MAESAVPPAAIGGFLRRWEDSGAAERANYAMFLGELCDVLEVSRPDPAGPDDEKNAYVFERAVPFPNPDGTTTVKRIDLYKRDCFVLEAKQGSEMAEEEKRGIIRWLRPEFQNPAGAQPSAATQRTSPIENQVPDSPAAPSGSRGPWPKTLPEQAQAVRAALAENPAGLTAEQMARLFLRARTQTVTELLETLVSLGQARLLEDGRYVST